MVTPDHVVLVHSFWSTLRATPWVVHTSFPPAAPTAHLAHALSPRPVMVADMYGADVPQPVELLDDRVELTSAQQANGRAILRSRMTAAIEALLADTDVTEVILMGYCFGGTGAAEIIRNPPEGLIGKTGGQPLERLDAGYAAVDTSSCVTYILYGQPGA